MRRELQSLPGCGSVSGLHLGISPGIPSGERSATTAQRQPLDDGGIPRQDGRPSMGGQPSHS